MILKKIAGICKNENEVLLLDQEDGYQWAGTGSAIYKLEGLPTVSKTSLCTMLDIPPEKAAGMQVNQGEFPKRYQAGAEYAAGTALNFDCDELITYQRLTLLPCTGDGKAWFLRAKYLEPLADSDALSLVAREDGAGKPYIEAWDGLFLAAILMPIKHKQAMEWMRELAAMEEGTKAERWQA